MDPVPWQVSLKWILLRRLAVLASLFTAVVVALIAANVIRDAQRNNRSVADALGSQLKLQLLRIDSALDASARFPDWGAVIDFVLLPGQCAEFRPTEGASNSSCFGQESSLSAPRWFERLLALPYPAGVETVRPIEHRDVPRGTIVVSLGPQALAGSVYNSLVPVLTAWFAAVAMCAGLIYIAVGQALRPTAQIMEGLNRLAAGDLAWRLGSYDVGEFDQMAQVFNGLAANLESATGERNEMARRLVDASEQERRRLARDLHDDVAQRLTALCGLATSIRTALNVKHPELVGEADQVLAIASKAMGSLRETLGNLRPQELDDLGLIVALESLIHDYRRRRGGTPAYLFSSSGRFDTLRPGAAVHVYRIVQEALSNATQHADASNISVSITSDGADKRAGVIRLTVADDGKGIENASETSRERGLGLAGIRERVLALNGMLRIDSVEGQGTQIHVDFPVNGTQRVAS